MDNQTEKQYREHVRGVATYILLRKQDPPITALDLVRMYQLDLATVTADIEAIVQSERRKAGGVFEVS